VTLLEQLGEAGIERRHGTVLGCSTSPCIGALYT
jgi:hypothetical protein